MTKARGEECVGQLANPNQTCCNSWATGVLSKGTLEKQTVVNNWGGGGGVTETCSIEPIELKNNYSKTNNLPGMS